jgi:hypothetical protein
LVFVELAEQNSLLITYSFDESQSFVHLGRSSTFS